jgi:hypothetical protein
MDDERQCEEAFTSVVTVLNVQFEYWDFRSSRESADVA